MWYGVIWPPAPWYRSRENMANAAGIEPAQQDLESRSPALEHERPCNKVLNLFTKSNPHIMRPGGRVISD